MIGIYKITSPTGRVYIGQSVDIEKRWRVYRGTKNIDKQRKLSNSFKKHGVENHIFEIVEECEFEQLNIKERFWQDHFDVLNGGLNCILTNTEELPGKMSKESRDKVSDAHRGKKGRLHSEETKKKIGDANKGRPRTTKQLEALECYLDKIRGTKGVIIGTSHTEETKSKLREIRLGTKATEETKKKIGDAGRGEKNPMYGKTHTEDTRRRISEKVKENNPFSKIVLDTETGIYYSSIREAAKTYDISNSYLSIVLRGDYENKTNLILV